MASVDALNPAFPLNTGVQVYIYTAGFTHYLDSNGLMLATNASNNSAVPNPLSVVSNSITGDPMLKLPGTSYYLNVSVDGTVSMSLTNQSISLNSNGTITIKPIKGSSWYYLSIVLDEALTTNKLAYTDQPSTYWSFLSSVNYSPVIKSDMVSIYNQDLIPYFPIEKPIIRKMFNGPGICYDTHRPTGYICQVQDSVTKQDLCGFGSKEIKSDCREACYLPNSSYLACASSDGLGSSSKYCYTNKPTNSLEICAIGGPGTVDSGGKLNQCACLNDPDEFPLYDRCFRNDTQKGCMQSRQALTDKVYGPWVEDAKDTQSIKSYCMQHHTTTNGPLLFTDPRCLNWASDNPSNYQLLLDSYCRLHPNSPLCSQFCANQPQTQGTCYYSMQQYCADKNNTPSPACREWCKNTNVDCDSTFANYCTSLGSPTDALAADPELCGCFLPTTFYNNFFNTLQSKITLPPDFQPSKQCFFGACAGSKIQPYNVKQTTGKICPNVQTCLQQVNFNNSGVIEGDVTVKANNFCNFSLPKTYSFQTGPWGPCQSDAFGNGLQTRSVKCVANDGTIGPDESCYNVSSKPSSYQECILPPPPPPPPSTPPTTTNSTGTTTPIQPPPPPPPPSYDYYIGPWDLCINNVRQRTVYCADSSGNEVPVNNCSKTVPSNSQVCDSGTSSSPSTTPTNGGSTSSIPTVPTVSKNYVYQTTDWGACETQGKQTRLVFCYDNTLLNKVDYSLCKSLIEPSVTRTCLSGMVQAVPKKNLYIAIVLAVLGFFTLVIKKVHPAVAVVFVGGASYFAWKYIQDKQTALNNA